MSIVLRAKSSLVGALLAFMVCILPAHVAASDDRALACRSMTDAQFKLQFDAVFAQGTQGWFFVKSDFEMFLRLSEEALGVLQQVKARLKARNIDLLLLPIPPKSLIVPEYLPADGVSDIAFFDPQMAAAEYEILLGSLRSAGLPFVDLHQAAWSDLTTEQRRELFFKRDRHWRPAAARLAAALAAQQLKAAHGFEDLPTNQYETKLSAENQPLNSLMSNAIEIFCDGDVATESLSHFTTRQTNADLDDFLAPVEESSEQITIVGSSFVHEDNHFNFAGFLRQETGLNVATHAIAGGQAHQAIYAWSHAPLAHAHPRFLVWEVPNLLDLNRRAELFERQILPALSGPCAGTDRELAKLNYRAGPRIGFSIDLSRRRSEMLYFHTELIGAAQHSFTVRLEYSDGHVEQRKLARPDRVGRVGHLFFDPPERSGADLQSVQIQFGGEGVSDGALSVCRPI
ncbi:MAG: hypothetical protein AAF737_04370 [Pseudomonadota bacterium]